MVSNQLYLIVAFIIIIIIIIMIIIIMIILLTLLTELGHNSSLKNADHIHKMIFHKGHQGLVQRKGCRTLDHFVFHLSIDFWKLT